MTTVEQKHAPLHKFAAGIKKNKPASWTTENPVSGWLGVELDGAGNITEIVAQNTKMEGTLDLADLLEQLPHLRVLDLYGHCLTFSAFSTSEKLLALPLVKFEIGRDLLAGAPLTGNFDFAHLPANFEHINLQCNEFTIKNWSNIAELTSLTSLWLPHNDLSSSGLSDFTALTSLVRLTHFSVASCKFPSSGATLDLAAVPTTVTFMILSEATNFTVHCSDISKFAQLKLDDCAKDRFSAVPVVLGSASDAGAAAALRVTGKQLLEIAKTREMTECVASFQQKLVAAAADKKNAADALAAAVRDLRAATQRNASFVQQQQRQFAEQRHRELLRATYFMAALERDQQQQRRNLTFFHDEMVDRHSISMEREQEASQIVMLNADVAASTADMLLAIHIAFSEEADAQECHERRLLSFYSEQLAAGQLLLNEESTEIALIMLHRSECIARQQLCEEVVFGSFKLRAALICDCESRSRVRAEAEALSKAPVRELLNSVPAGSTAGAEQAKEVRQIVASRGTRDAEERAAATERKLQETAATADRAIRAAEQRAAAAEAAAAAEKAIAAEKEYKTNERLAELERILHAMRPPQSRTPPASNPGGEQPLLNMAGVDNMADDYDMVSSAGSRDFGPKQ